SKPQKGPGPGGCPVGAGSAPAPPATPARVLWVRGGGLGQRPKDLGLPRIRRWGKIRPGPKTLLGQPRGASTTPPPPCTLCGAPKSLGTLEPRCHGGRSRPAAAPVLILLLQQDRAPAQHQSGGGAPSWVLKCRRGGVPLQGPGLWGGLTPRRKDLPPSQGDPCGGILARAGFWGCPEPRGEPLRGAWGGVEREPRGNIAHNNNKRSSNGNNNNGNGDNNNSNGNNNSSNGNNSNSNNGNSNSNSDSNNTNGKDNNRNDNNNRGKNNEGAVLARRTALTARGAKLLQEKGLKQRGEDEEPPRSRGARGAAVPGMAACWGTWTGRRVLSVATGAGAVYLLYRTVAEALSSVPGGTDRYRLESPDHQDGLPVEEVLSRRVCEELLEMLRAQQDGRSRSAILRSITRCVYLMDTKNPTCSPEHIQLVASCLDDHNGDTKVQALNTLRAFATRSLFTARVQDFYPKILDLVISSRDTEVQVAALRLLNALPVPPNIEPLLRRAVPNLLGFLQWDNYAIQVRRPPRPAGTPQHGAHPPSRIPGVSAAAGPQAAHRAVPQGRAPARHPQLPGPARIPEPHEQLAAGEAAPSTRSFSARTPTWTNTSWSCSSTPRRECSSRRANSS
uniref:Armadillo repeat-containing domain-containing protein n=2 Tax=Anser cygnoides TaxID=8845 RepID=A0A8B9DD38_ANSCY